MADQDVIDIANLIYAENGGEDIPTMIMTGSSAWSRLRAGKAQEFGSNIKDVLQKGYASVQKRSDMWRQAESGKFPDELSETAYKRAMQVSYGLKKWLQPVEGYSGNIDLINRKILWNPPEDQKKYGLFGTEYSKSFRDDAGKEVLIPTIVDGKRLSDKDAWAHYKKTGQHLGKFDSIDEANKMAERIHNRGYPLMDVQFFFRDKEAPALRKKLKFKGRVGKYDTYSY